MKRSIYFFINSLGGGGAERVVSVLSRCLSEKGYPVSIVMLWKRPLVYEVPEGVKLICAEDLPVRSVYGKAVRRVYALYSRLRQGIYKPLMTKLQKYDDKPRSNETAFYFYATYAMPYRELLKKAGDAAAFGFLLQSNVSLLMAARGKRGVKTVFCERNNPVRPDVAKNIVRLRDKLYHRADAGVFQTDEQATYYTKLKKRKYVIPNPVRDGLPEWTGDARHDIVNFCRLEAQKNLPLLVDAFEKLHQEFPAYRLTIYGKGDYREALLGYIADKGLADSVAVEPFAGDIHTQIRDAAMFVSTSDFEGLSNSMLEAMAMGLPCVCTDCDGGGARMMIRDHENGLLVPKGDAEAVYRAMKEIIEDPALAEKLSRNARKVREELAVDRIVEKWIKVL